MLVSLPADDPDRARVGRALAQELVALAHRAPEGSRGWLIEEINGAAAATDPAAPFLLEAGFAATAMGLQLRVARGLRAAPRGPTQTSQIPQRHENADSTISPSSGSSDEGAEDAERRSAESAEDAECKSSEGAEDADDAVASHKRHIDTDSDNA